MIIASFKMTSYAAINTAVSSVNTGLPLNPKVWAQVLLDTLVPDSQELQKALQLDLFGKLPISVPTDSKLTLRVWLEENVAGYVSYIALLLNTNKTLEKFPDLVAQLNLFPLVSDGNFARRILLEVPYDTYMNLTANEPRFVEVLDILSHTNDVVETLKDKPEEVVHYAEFYNSTVYNSSAMKADMTVDVSKVVVGRDMDVRTMSNLTGLMSWYFSTITFFKVSYTKLMTSPETKYKVATVTAVIVLLLILIFK